MEKTKSLFQNKRFVKIFYAVLVLIIALGIFLYVYLSKDKVKIELATVKRGDISEKFETTAIVESGGQKSYMILNGTKVTELNVKIGDSVKKGDVLAKFDTSGVTPLINQKQNEYNEANSKYKNALESINNANYQIAEINKNIKELEGLAQMITEKNIKDHSESEQQPMTIDQLKAVLDAVGGGGSVLSDEQLNSIYKQIEAKGGTVFSKYGGKDIQKIISSGSSTDNQLLSLELQISLLNSQKNMLDTANTQTLLDTYKTIVDSAKHSLDEILAQKEVLDKGWIALTNGVITQVNVKEGQVYEYSAQAQKNDQDILSMLEGLTSNGIDINTLANDIRKAQEMSTGVGLVQDSYTDYSASFKLGKYDSQKIKVNMPVKISFLSNKYNGYVSYISAKAENSSSGISAITGSGSNASNKLVAKVSIKNPDKNLIVGFDAKLSIKTDERKGVLLVPIEAIQVDEKDRYVYLYDEETKNVIKKSVEVGISSEKYYEIKSGLKENDKVVKNLSNELKEGAKFYVGD